MCSAARMESSGDQGLYLQSGAEQGFVQAGSGVLVAAGKGSVEHLGHVRGRNDGNRQDARDGGGGLLAQHERQHR